MKFETHFLQNSLFPSVEQFVSSKLIDTIKKYSAESDISGKQAQEVISILQHERYFGLLIPEEFSGGGASALECCAVQHTIAKQDPALAVGLNMHLFSTGILFEHWKHEKDISWALMEAVATQDRIIASAYAEPNLGGNILRQVQSEKS